MCQFVVSHVSTFHATDVEGQNIKQNRSESEIFGAVNLTIGTGGDKGNICAGKKKKK